MSKTIEEIQKEKSEMVAAMRQAVNTFMSNNPGLPLNIECAIRYQELDTGERRAMRVIVEASVVL